MPRYIQLMLLQATICMQTAMMVSPSDQCGVDVREYSSSSKCLAGFSSQHLQLYPIIADGECHDSGTEDLGYYVATCDSGTSWFKLSRSGCTDETCSDCTETNAFSGKNQEGGCMIDWIVSDLEHPGSVPFSAVADGECHSSGIGGLGYYVATCHDDGYWFQLSRSGCTDETCSDCTGTSENKVSPFRKWPATLTSGGQLQCTVDAFYKEQVWSMSGSCQRPGCSGSDVLSLPAKWWPSSISRESLQCIYGDDYPEEYYLNGKLRDSLLFDSRDECCEAYARVLSCQPTPSPTIPPDAIGNVTLKNSAIIRPHSSLFGFSSFILLLSKTIMQIAILWF